MAQIAAVDHQIGGGAQAIQQQPLLADAVGDRPVLGQRMAPAGFGIAALQDLIGTGQIDQLHPECRIGFEPLDALQQRFGAEASCAAVDGDGHGPVEALRRGKKGQRQVIDRLVAQILQRPQSGAVARTRQAGDEDEG